nr:Type II secretory pathway component [uncultured Pseudomonas sp.]
MFRTLCLSLLFGTGLVAAQGVDPTQPPADLLPVPGDAAQSETMPTLQSVLRTAKSSRAVIDGQNLQVGDEYAGIRVLAIYPQAVLIERREQRQLLRLAEPVLQPSR